MTRRLTDEEVSRLPLATGRLELMEEILRQRGGAEPVARRRRQGLVAVLGAAAAVAAVVTALVVVPWRGGDGGPPAPATDPATAHTAATDPATPARGPRDWVVLDADGWETTYVAHDGTRHEVTYQRGGQELGIQVMPGDWHATWGGAIDQPARGPETTVTLLGRDAVLKDHGPRSHTTVGAVEGDWFPEVRGTGMDRATYLSLLEALRWDDREAYPPDSGERFLVLPEDRAEVLARLVAGLPQPDGGPRVRSEEVELHRLQEDVVDTVACAWFERLEDAHGSGDEAAVHRAERALSSARHWPVLHEMLRHSDYPHVVWDLTARVERGDLPDWYADDLGCAGR